MTIKSKFRHAGCYSLLAFAPIGCSGGSDEESEPDDTSAPGIEIRYTEYGIPHVRASEYRDLGFGQGYAQARDNLCKIELGMLGFKGEFSRHFGGDAPRNSMTFTAPSSQVSDLYFKGIVDSHVVEDLVAKPAPLGPRRYPGRRGAASSRGTLTS